MRCIGQGDEFGVEVGIDSGLLVVERHSCFQTEVIPYFGNYWRISTRIYSTIRIKLVIVKEGIVTNA